MPKARVLVAARQLPASTCAALVSQGCNFGGHRDVHPYLDEPFPEKLSAWHLFAASAKGGHLTPNAGVLPYDLNTPLFSDFATKQRYVWMPPSTSAAYQQSDTFEFPVGTIIAKTFSYPGRVIETRLLVHARDGWVGLPYVWNADGTEANLEIAPDPQKVEYTTTSGEKLTIDAAYVKARVEGLAKDQDLSRFIL